MAAQTFDSFNGLSQFTIEDNIVYAFFTSLKNYSKKTIGDIMPNREGEFNNHIIKNWYESEFSRDLKSKFQRIRSKIPSGVVNWEFTANKHEMGHDEEQYKWTASNTTRGQVMEGGLLGLFQNLVHFMSIFRSDQLARTEGSANNGSTAYTITVRRLFNASSRLLRDLSHDKTLTMLNNQKLKLYNPTSDYTYCGAQVLDYAMKKHGKDKFTCNIPDEAMNNKEFIELIKRFVDNKWLLKKVMVWKLRKHHNVHKLELIYPDKKIFNHEKNVEIVIDKDHVWLKEGEKKKRVVDNDAICDICKRTIEEKYLTYHREKCEIARSRQLENIHCKKREYSGEEYTIEKLENMENDSNRKFNMVKQELMNGRSVYLTGPGGNGKTHLVKKLLFNIPGKSIVLSPTGIVASDYGLKGSTWQKLFLPNIIFQHKPFEYLLDHPDDFKQLVIQYLKKYWETKPAFLVMEECSMIRGIDCRYISECLKILFDDDRIFGGIPMLICGDPAQLEPVDENDKLADLYFTDETISQIRKHGLVIKMEHPRRLLKSGMSNVEAVHQFNILQNMRNSIVTDDFFNIVNRMEPDDFYELLRNGHFERNTKDIVLTPSNERNYCIIKTAQNGQNLEKVGKNYQGNDFFIKKNMKLIVRDNQAVSSNLVFNGTACWVVDWKVGEWVKIRIKGGKEFKVYKGKGSIGMNANNFALDPFFVRTVHLSQGCTIEGKLFFYAQSARHSISSKWGAGHIYTLFSRVTDLRNIVFVCESDKRLQDIIKPNYCWTYKPVLDVIKDPTAELSINTMVGDDGKMSLRDSNSINGFFSMRDKRTITKEGHHADRYMTENEMRYDNTIIYDHETRQVDKMGLKKHEIGFSTLVWFFQGKFEYFDEFVLRNGGIIDDLEMFEKDDGKMIFDDMVMENVTDSIYDWILRVLSLVEEKFDENERDDWTNSMKNELALLIRYPIRLIGFNNLGYDDRFFMEHLLRKKTSLEETYTHAGGSNLKQFILKYGNDPKQRVALKSWDLSLVIGVGSLDAHIKSNVLKNVDKPELFMTINSRLWIHGITPFNVSILEDENKDKWYDLDDQTKREIIRIWASENIEWRHFQNSDENLKTKYLQRALDSAHYFVDRCEIAGRRDEILLSDLNKRDKKGSCALKLYTRLGKNDEHVIDLIEYMRDENGELDFSKAFFDGKKGKKLLEDKGEDFFRNYNVHKEMREYGINDVVVSILLLAIKDNSMAYNFGDDLKEFQFKKSWNGLGLSLLRFDTTCQYSMFITTALMDENALFKDMPDKTKFHTKFPTLPIEAAKIIERICGGKTQARRIHFKAPLDENGMPRLEDCMGYLDVSGMYMRVQEKIDYPYGHFSLWNNVFQDKLDKIVDQFNENNPELWKRCRIFVFKGKCHPKEIENVGGVKCNGKLLYTNEPVEYAMTNYELKEFKKYSGTIIEMKTILEWESQGPIFKTPMTYYADKKNNARDGLERNNAKLLANSSFGAYNQKDKNRKMIVIKNADDAHDIYDKYPSGIKNRKEIDGKLIGHVEDTEVTNHYKPSYIGGFTLGGSKPMLYDIIFNGLGGDARFENFKDMPAYGDTDSLVVNMNFISRLIEHDKQVEEKDRILFSPGDDKNLKAGKLTDELSDDIDKYFDRAHEYHSSFGTQTSNFKPHIFCCFNPASKSGGVKFITPPTHWPDGRIVTKDDCPTPQEVPWIECYKCFLKGVAKNAILELNDEERGVYFRVEGIGHNKETFDLLEHAYKWSIKIKTWRKDSIIKRVLFTNNIQEDEGMSMFGIYNIEDPGREVWGYPNNGRMVVMKPGYEERSVQEWARLGVNAFECSDGFTVPYGYQFD